MADTKKETVAHKQEIALKKIAALFEEQMTVLGMTEREKNAKVADFTAYVNEKVSSAKTSKFPTHRHNGSRQEDFQTV